MVCTYYLALATIHQSYVSSTCAGSGAKPSLKQA